MADSQHLRHDTHARSTISTFPPSHPEAAKRPSEATSSIDHRRRPRPKLTSYITGQLAKSNPATSNNASQQQPRAFDYDSSSPAISPKAEPLLESIHKHVLVNPLQPLPVHFNAAFSYITEAFQKLNDDLAQSKHALGEENEIRQAAEKSWATEKECLEKEIERLKDLVDPGRVTPRDLKKGLQEFAELNKLRYPLQSVTQSGELSDRLLRGGKLRTHSPTPESPSPFVSKPHELRSDLKSREISDSKEYDENDTTTISPTAQDTKNLQTIASLVAKRQGIPIADVWNDVAYLYFDHFKPNGPDADFTTVEASANQMGSSKGMCVGYDQIMPFQTKSIYIDRGPPLTTISNIHGHRRNFSFNIGDDSADQSTSLTLPPEPLSAEKRQGEAPRPRDDLLNCGTSPQNSIRSSTTPESDKRSWEWWRRSRIPSPAQDSSFLARPRRESSASSMLTTIHTPRENPKAPSDVPRVALTPVYHSDDGKDYGFDVKPRQIQGSEKVMTPSIEKSAPRKLLQMKSADSLRKMGEARLTTSNFARRMKNIGSGARSPSS